MRQDPAFVICDAERLAALRDADRADSPAAEFEAVSVAYHLWQAQQQAVMPLMKRAEEETRNGYDVHPFTDWLQRWTDETSRRLRPLAERNNALVAQLGKRAAEKIGRQRARPRLDEIQARIDAAESAGVTGLLSDLEAARPHDDLLKPISESTREVEIRETENIRLRPLTEAERSVFSGDYAWSVVALDDGEEAGVIGLQSDQDLSNVLDDQWSRPTFVGQMHEGGFCFAFKGRYFIATSLGRRTTKAFERLHVEPRKEGEIRRFVQANLPPPQSHFERLIAWAHDPENEEHALVDIIEHIELERVVHEGDESELNRVAEEIREDLRRSHEKALLTTSELSQCLQALGDEPILREVIPEHVRHAVWRRDRGRCVKCGSQERLEFDHIVPFSRGGSNTERNVQLLCQGCNRSKGATI